MLAVTLSRSAQPARPAAERPETSAAGLFAELSTVSEQ